MSSSMSPAMKIARKILAGPLTPLFSAVVKARNSLFDAGILPSRSYPVCIISVGNISVGGTGKTPMVSKLVKELKRLEKKVAIVSRGYGGSFAAQAAQVEVKGANAAAMYGDEPAWLAKTLEVPVFVAPARRHAVELCLRESKPDVIIADDCFQHRWLKRDVDIVLLDAQDMFIDLLPAGRFREPLSSVRRADYVILTKANLVSNAELEEWMSRLKEFGFSFHLRNLFRAGYEIAAIEPQKGVARLADRAPVLLVSGIAQPQAFKDLVEPKHPVRDHLTKPDHHLWSQADIDTLVAAAAKEEAADVLVTEKDFIKMQNLHWGSLRLHVVKLELNIEPEFPYADLVK